MHLVGIQRLACSLPTASRVHSLTPRHLTVRPSQPCAQLLCPRLGLHMSLTPLTRLSSYGPASLDSAPNLEHVQTCEGKTMGQRLEVRGYEKTISPPAPLPFSESARAEDALVEPAWMAKGLDSPDVRVASGLSTGGRWS